MAATKLFRAYDRFYKAPSTPLSLDDVPDTQEIDNVVLELAREYGTPVAYIQEQDGRVVQNIFPIKASATEQISSSSDVTLHFHTESAFHPLRPSALLLYCVRGDPTAKTTYAELDDIFPLLSDESATTLTERLFFTSVDLSFRTHGEVDQDVLLAVFPEDTDDWSMIYDSSAMRGVGKDAEAALEDLHDAIATATKTIVLEAGDALLINNSNTVHGRLPFTPRYDGTDRWLKRCLIRKGVPVQYAHDGIIRTTTFSAPG